MGNLHTARSPLTRLGVGYIFSPPLRSSRLILPLVSLTELDSQAEQYVEANSLLALMNKINDSIARRAFSR